MLCVLELHSVSHLDIIGFLCCCRILSGCSILSLLEFLFQIYLTCSSSYNWLKKEILFSCINRHRLEGNAPPGLNNHNPRLLLLSCLLLPHTGQGRRALHGGCIRACWLPSSSSFDLWYSWCYQGYKEICQLAFYFIGKNAYLTQPKIVFFQGFFSCLLFLSLWWFMV